jgi:DNA-binding FadR family transcriptional regulator
VRKLTTEQLEFDRIPRRRRSQDVAERLEQMIRTGRYTIGEQLPSERELMARFGVGRPAVREALYSLQMMGIVELGNGERPRVTEPKPEVLIRELSGAVRHLLAKPDGTRQFQEARLFFEVGLARYASEFASEADIRKLESILKANKQSIKHAAEFNKTDIEFHYTLAAIPRNDIFTAIYKAMVGWLKDQMWVTGRVPRANLLAYRGHASIYRAIVARDAQKAADAVKSHLAHVSDFYQRARAKET